LTFGRLSESNEITAVRASGLAAWSYVRMPLLVAALVAVFLVPFNTSWAPRAHAHFRELFLQVLKRSPLARLEEKTFIEIGDYRLFFERRDKKAKLLKGITIYKIPVEGPPLRIFAERGRAVVDPVHGMKFLLEAGRIEQVDPDHPTEWFQTRFDTYQLAIPLGKTEATSERAIEEISSRELRAEIQRLRQKNMKAPLFSCQVHLRLALAVTPLLFALMGIPLAIRMHRGGRSIGFGLSILILLAYYILLMGGTALGQRGQWPPWLAVWLGNFILLGVAGGLSWRFLKQ
jgi:lipopolysaccharide export LptBFGC system permease protein LptF